MQLSGVKSWGAIPNSPLMPIQVLSITAGACFCIKFFI